MRRLYIEDGSAIDRELYLSALVDRGSSRIAFIASTEGGMDIEKVAKETPDKIKTFTVDPVAGYSPYVGLDIATALDLHGDQAKQCGMLIRTLYDAFLAKDMSLLEINPLVVTKDGRVVCLDAKINFDDNALFRHKDVQALRDPNEEDPMEREAAKYELSYVKLDGSIGCMVNGAGLAMATMDIIKLYGEEPANFLDVGGGASKEKVTAAFKIILSDPNVKGILVNIFGGIMRCDIIAEGIIAAAHEVRLSGAARGAAGGHQRRTGHAKSLPSPACPLSPARTSPMRRIRSSRPSKVVHEIGSRPLAGVGDVLAVRRNVGHCCRCQTTAALHHSVPLKRLTVGSKWLVHSCTDGKSLVFTAQAGAAAPFEFDLTFTWQRLRS